MALSLDLRQRALAALRGAVAAQLQREVAAMNVGNFIVRPKRKLVETYAKPEAWETLGEDARHVLADEVANLPAELDAERLEAKQFDMLMLDLQLCLLKRQAGFAKLKKQALEIATALEEQASIPIIHAELPLIQELQTDAWWQDVTGRADAARPLWSKQLQTAALRSPTDVPTTIECATATSRRSFTEITNGNQPPYGMSRGGSDRR